MAGVKIPSKSNKCYVPGCKSGYASERKRLKELQLPPPPLFKPPPDMLEEWNRKIPRQDRKLELHDVVCSLHFPKEDVLKEFDDVGMLRDRLKLKIGSVPCIFPNCPERMTKVVKKRPAPGQRNTKAQQNVGEQSKSKAGKRKPKEEATHNKKARMGNDNSGCLAEETMSLIVSSSESPNTLPSESYNSVDLNQTTCQQEVSYQNGEESPFLKRTSHDDLRKVKLPNERWTVIIEPTAALFVHINDRVQVDRYVKLNEDSVASVVIREKETDFKRKIDSVSGLQIFLRVVHDIKLCPGCDDRSRHALCTEYLKKDILRCFKCKERNKYLVKVKRRQYLAKLTGTRKIKARSSRNNRLRKKVTSLNEKLASKYDEQKKIDDDRLDALTKDLPPPQQEVVKACVMAAKAKDPRGRRYTPEWVYECILLRIKSPALYRRMIRENTLPLPSIRTLQRYIKKLKPAYGFQNATFKLIGAKTPQMPAEDRHGCLLIDEMALDQGVSYNKSTYEVDGFVNLGAYTSERDETMLADHALVVMFQPFKGTTYFQSLGAFATKGAAKGPILEKIIVEAIALCEQNGLFVDEVTTDGGSWNRNMWACFGITESEPLKYNNHFITQFINT